MGIVLDKILNVMKLDGDDDFEYDNDDLEFEDEEPVIKSSKPFSQSTDFEDDFYSKKKNKEKSMPRMTNKITPIRSGRSSKNTADMEVCVIKPSAIEDEREITDTLLDGVTVVLNIEGLAVDIAQRIIDFTSGSCYAIGGKLQKISNYIFIITPANVDISGDFQSYIEGFDPNSFKSEF